MSINIHNFHEFQKHFLNTRVGRKDLRDSLIKIFSEYTFKRVDIIFLSLYEMKKLNKEFREKNTPTDVLTFSIEDKPVVGEIYICPEYISQEYTQEEVLRAIAHGFLHLMGYTHKEHFSESSEKKEKMFEKQEDMLQNILYEVNNRSR